MAEAIKKSSCILCTRRCGAFQTLTPQQLEMLDKERFEIHYKAGETIIKQGTHISDIISFNSGLAKMFFEEPDGSNLIIKILSATELVGGPGVFYDNRHHFSLTALTDATTCLINVGQFKSILLMNEKFTEEFIKDLSKNTIQVYERFATVTRKQMPGRIADALIYFMNEVFKSSSFDIVLSRKELAQFTAMSLESVCRILKDFADEKIIKLKGSKLDILDKERLFQISKNG